MADAIKIAADNLSKVLSGVRSLPFDTAPSPDVAERCNEVIALLTQDFAALMNALHADAVNTGFETVSGDDAPFLPDYQEYDLGIRVESWDDWNDSEGGRRGDDARDLQLARGGF